MDPDSTSRRRLPCSPDAFFSLSFLFFFFSALTRWTPPQKAQFRPEVLLEGRAATRSSPRRGRCPARAPTEPSRFSPLFLLISPLIPHRASPRVHSAMGERQTPESGAKRKGAGAASPAKAAGRGAARVGAAAQPVSRGGSSPRQRGPVRSLFPF